ncbi:flagellum-specific peptidoglycan hydrolase FlgJ [Flavobacteriaceae bacterium MAR_2010_72]|nr:flagellum-specific peptidoglycan hydrolase FlgJ [Flavobacteriaceae bacterium MAR_2010_72]
MKRIVVIILLCLVVVSCGSKKKIVTKKKDDPRKTERVVISNDDVENVEEDRSVEEKPTTSYANATEAYIANFSGIAMEEMRRYKIPASITLAQGILESGSARGRLAVEANNHFGIKCHDWTGDKIYHDDDASQECFRKYKHVQESFEDHSKFLTGRSRYAGLFSLDDDDYRAWAKGLRAAGYATDRKYPEKLISLIERFELYKYDEMVLQRPARVYPEEASVTTHKVEKGDTLYSLSKRYGVAVVDLQKLNNMTNNDLKIGQILLIKNN